MQTSIFRLAITSMVMMMTRSGLACQRRSTSGSRAIGVALGVGEQCANEHHHDDLETALH
jgi:hypothetical protein